MRDGFVRVAVATPEIKVADCVYNAQSIIAEIKKAAMQKVKLLVWLLRQLQLATPHLQVL